MKLPVSLTRGFGRQILVLKKESPNIFFVAGVIGSITSTVLACRATLNLSVTLDKINKDLSEVKQTKEIGVENTYTDMNYKQDLAYVYVKGGLQIAKLYGPAVIVGAASITALTGSHVQMQRRNAALMAAYAAVQRAYEDYRGRVREELGDEKELEIYHSAEVEVVDKKKIASADPNTWSPYARFFDEYNKNWVKDPELNRLFVQCNQNYANQLLRARGHVLLNDVYDMLGMERTKAGMVVGWVIGKTGDNFIDFGLYEARNSRFVNGVERSILLDFNVDGVIYDQI
jgi:Family of unknown function (DUF6353)